MSDTRWYPGHVVTLRDLGLEEHQRAELDAGIARERRREQERIFLPTNSVLKPEDLASHLSAVLSVAGTSTISLRQPGDGWLRKVEKPKRPRRDLAGLVAAPFWFLTWLLTLGRFGGARP